MAEPASYTPGDQDVSQQRSMYRTFNDLLHWGSLSLATVLSFFVLWLCAHIGFFPALIVAVIVLVAGSTWLLRPKSH